MHIHEIDRCVQSRQFLASTLPEHLFEYKNEETIEKSENLCDMYTSKCLCINTMHGLIQSRETVPLKGPGHRIDLEIVDM
jgi:hypothetical protein